MRRVYLFSIILLFFTVMICMNSVPAFASGPASEQVQSSEFFDYSEDQTGYGEIVARLARMTQIGDLLYSGVKEDEITAASREKVFFAVLCRTNGNEVEFRNYEPVYIVAGPHDCYTLFFSEFSLAEKTVAALSKRSDIRYAELDSEVEACGKGEYFFHSWCAEDMHFGPYLSYSSQCSEGSVTVAVIDSGVFLHSAYSGRILESGYDYIDGDYDSTNDLFGHGTNVAGIIAECTQGFPVYLYPIRALNASGGGSILNVTNAVREATQKGVNVINLSLVSKSHSDALNDAILDSVAEGITVVAAAGNYAMDTSQISPADIDSYGVIIVGAAESDGRIASYSNYGDSVDLYTYGTEVECCSRSGGYTTNTGTSIAAPHIAGLSSLLVLTHPGITPEEIETRIRAATEQEKAINTPDLIRITPDNPGFYLRLLRMDPKDRIQLFTEIRPITAMEDIHYSSSDESVVMVLNGCLIPTGIGTATVTAQCLGLTNICFEVEVVSEGCNTLSIPTGITEIEQEAFYGVEGFSHVVVPESVVMIGTQAFKACTNLRTVILPSSLLSIEDNAFPDVIFICQENSLNKEFVIKHDLQYILTK